MFRCQICGVVAPAGSRANKVVLASRVKNYAPRGSQSKFQPRFRGGRPSRSGFDKGGEGQEIVQEVLACDSCADEAKTPTPIPLKNEPSTDDTNETESNEE